VRTLSKIVLFGSALFVLSIQTHGQLKPATLLRNIEPKYADSMKDYLVDPVAIKLVVDEKGIPFSLESSTALPPNIVRAVAEAKFAPATQNGKTVAVSTTVTMQVRWPYSHFQSVEDRPSTGDPKVWGQLERAGWSLKPTDATALETNLKDRIDSAESRATLIAYASTVVGDEFRLRQTRHIEWLVRNQPDSGMLGKPAAMLFTAAGPYQNANGFDQIRKRWLEQIEATPNNMSVLGHAAYFLRLSDPETAEQLLTRALPRMGGVATWLGELYALTAIGTTSLNYKNGMPITAESRFPDSGFGKHAQRELQTTTDRRVLLSALDVIHYGGSSLAKAKALPEGFDSFCRMLLQRVKEFHPDTTVSCDLSSPGSGDDVQAGALVNHPNPPYPSDAHSKAIQGNVRFAAIVGTDGKIQSADLLSGPLVFYEPCLSALKKWSYKPTMLNGEPVEVLTQIDINFVR